MKSISSTANSSDDNINTKQQQDPTPEPGPTSVEEGGGGSNSMSMSTPIPNKPSKEESFQKKKTWIILGMLLAVAAIVAIVVAVVVLGDNDNDDQDDTITTPVVPLFQNPSTVKWKLRGQVIYDPLGNITRFGEDKVDFNNRQDSRTFGNSVDLAGDWLVMGTYHVGVVYIYRWNETASDWYEHTVLEQTAQDAADYEAVGRATAWGSALAVANDRIAVSSGHWLERVQTWVYDESSDTWKLHNQPILALQSGDRTGSSVALSADAAVMAIGSYAYGISQQNDGTGLIRVLEQRNTVSWQVQGSVTGFARNDNVGRSMKLSADGRTLIAGNALKNSDIGYASGIVWVWRRSSNNNDEWDLLGKPLLGPSPNSFFGWGVQVSGDVISVVAAKYEGKGGIFVYEYVAPTASASDNGEAGDNEVWKQRGDVILNKNGIQSRHCLTADGNMLVVASEMDDITVYQYKDGDWEVVGSFEDESEFFVPQELTNTVTCSSDGRTIVVGRQTWVDVGAVSVWQAVEGE